MAIQSVTPIISTSTIQRGIFNNVLVGEKFKGFSNSLTVIQEIDGTDELTLILCETASNVDCPLCENQCNWYLSHQERA